jgi:hypothetical protein
MLPPAGPGALDLLLMSMLAKHTSVVPVLSQVGASDEAALQRTRELLAKPGLIIPELSCAIPTLACVPRHWHHHCALLLLLPDALWLQLNLLHAALRYAGQMRAGLVIGRVTAAHCQ